MNNGTVIIPQSKPELNPMQQACVDCLSDALEEALKGRITAVALVVCMDDGIGTTMAGTNGVALNIGCDKIKREILEAIFIDGNLARKRSNILKVRP